MLYNHAFIDKRISRKAFTSGFFRRWEKSPGLGLEKMCVFVSVRDDGLLKVGLSGTLMGPPCLENFLSLSEVKNRTARCGTSGA